MSGCPHVHVYSSRGRKRVERLIRYEDLLEHDLEVLQPLLLDECQLPVDRARFCEILMTNRFERKGIAGDWRNYFSDEIARRFKNRFGGVLRAIGYERTLDW
jgi:hypothetical protein